MFPKTRASEKSYDGEIKRVNVLIKDAELFKKHAKNDEATDFHISENNI